MLKPVVFPTAAPKIPKKPVSSPSFSISSQSSGAEFERVEEIPDFSAASEPPALLKIHLRVQIPLMSLESLQKSVQLYPVQKFV